MDWKRVDERLIKRGELLLSLDFLKGYDLELSVMNDGKVGRPFKLTERYIEFLMVVRYLFSMPYRQLEGFTGALNRLIPKLPSADYSWVRRRILRLDLSPYKSLRKSDGPVVIAVDSSGVSVHKCGGWVERLYGRKKRYVKIHFAVDVKTKEVLAMDVTTDDVHDSEVLPSLIANASKHRLISEACMDGAYDSSKTYALLRKMGIKPIIKPRRNARTDRGPPERRNSVMTLKTLGEREWSRVMGYGRRWSAETAFSTFKRLYGEYSMAKNMENIAKELAAKAYIYNTLINLQN
jgi:transposase